MNIKRKLLTSTLIAMMLMPYAYGGSNSKEVMSEQSKSAYGIFDNIFGKKHKIAKKKKKKKPYYKTAALKRKKALWRKHTMNPK